MNPAPPGVAAPARKADSVAIRVQHFRQLKPAFLLFLIIISSKYWNL